MVATLIVEEKAGRNFGNQGGDSTGNTNPTVCMGSGEQIEKNLEGAAAAKVAPVPKAMDANHHFESVADEFRSCRCILEGLRGRLEGNDKDDVEKALRKAEALEVMCTQRGTDGLTQQDEEGRGEVRNLALLVQHVANESKEILEGTRSVACELEAAKETVTKIQNVLQGQVREQICEAATQKKEVEELEKEVHEARRIKMLHEPSKVMDLEHQVSCMRKQLLEKAAETVILRRLMELSKDRGGRDQGEKSLWCEIAGDERLGSTLSIVPLHNKVIDLSHCKIQWYRITDGSEAIDRIASAIRSQYAPEPFDVGRILRAEINLPGGKTQSVQTAGAINPTHGLDKYVETLTSKGGAQFNVTIVIKNGESVKKQLPHHLDVDENRIKLYKRHTVVAKEIYSTSMQICGARGGGDSTSLGLVWVPTKGQSFLLVLKSQRERNAAIMLARKFAKLQNIWLGGPGDTMEMET